MKTFTCMQCNTDKPLDKLARKSPQTCRRCVAKEMQPETKRRRGSSTARNVDYTNGRVGKYFSERFE